MGSSAPSSSSPTGSGVAGRRTRRRTGMRAPIRWATCRARWAALALPNLEALGLGHLTRSPAWPPARSRARRLGRDERGLGGQGHHHRALGDGGPGHRPGDGDLSDGFPPPILDELRAAAGGRGLLGNKTASGTAIIEELGAQHLATRRADPVHVGGLGVAARRARGGDSAARAVSRSAKGRARSRTATASGG